jgi:hypothetical protein
VVKASLMNKEKVLIAMQRSFMSCILIVRLRRWVRWFESLLKSNMMRPGGDDGNALYGRFAWDGVTASIGE